jgi:hypothetical protein
VEKIRFAGGQSELNVFHDGCSCFVSFSPKAGEPVWVPQATFRLYFCKSQSILQEKCMESQTLAKEGAWC